MVGSTVCFLNKDIVVLRLHVDNILKGITFLLWKTENSLHVFASSEENPYVIKIRYPCKDSTYLSRCLCHMFLFFWSLTINPSILSEYSLRRLLHFLSTLLVFKQKQPDQPSHNSILDLKILLYVIDCLLTSIYHYYDLKFEVLFKPGISRVFGREDPPRLEVSTERGKRFHNRGGSWPGSVWSNILTYYPLHPPLPTFDERIIKICSVSYDDNLMVILLSSLVTMQYRLRVCPALLYCSVQQAVQCSKGRSYELPVSSNSCNIV